MDFQDVRRALQELELPQGGFEDMLARLDALKGHEPVSRARRNLRERRLGMNKLKDNRAA